MIARLHEKNTRFLNALYDCMTARKEYSFILMHCMTVWLHEERENTNVVQSKNCEVDQQMNYDSSTNRLSRNKLTATDQKIFLFYV